MKKPVEIMQGKNIFCNCRISKKLALSTINSIVLALDNR